MMQNYFILFEIFYNIVSQIKTNYNKKVFPYAEGLVGQSTV